VTFTPLEPLSRREAVARAAAVPALFGIALAHLLDLPHKVEDAPYMALLFTGLIAACVGCAPAIVLAGVRTGRALWAVAATLSGLAIAGYCLSRAVALPQLEDHVGDWVSGPGVASLVLESAVLGLAVYANGAPVRVRLVPGATELAAVVTIALVVALAAAGLADGHGAGGARAAEAPPHGHELCVGCPPEPVPTLPAWAIQAAFVLAALGSYGAAVTLWRRAASPRSPTA
jgi:hypothetical protein